ncbi:hypothetical protein OS493_005158 [Desmophyllum pertusum]|uniref:Macro domain-containing protein n=1 Tax=Desmophyllum pertusum TaxID=174260 RepID=A0A9W9Z3R1_9CNID|nr:hypothetical protein OS493_005158 [Desmophyllum pertusum]
MVFFRARPSVVRAVCGIVFARCHSGGTVHATVIFSSLDKKATKRIEVVQNDLTKENVDAIVNAANSWLKHGGGVAGAIVKSGSNQIQIESDEYVDKNGPVKTGGIAVTGPGTLPCKIVIHAVGPVWEGGQKDEDNSLHSAMYNSLSECHSRQLSSVAVPAISSGIFGFPRLVAPRCCSPPRWNFSARSPRAPSNLFVLQTLTKPLWRCLRKLRVILTKSPTLLFAWAKRDYL